MKSQELINKGQLREELFSANSYVYLSDKIKQLERRDLPKEDQWKLMLETKDMLSGLPKERLVESLRKNPNILSMVSIEDFQFRLQTKYVPLVSVDVERSFSIYKHILRDRRQSLTLINLEMLNSINYNAFLFD